MQASALELTATILFALAIIHTFSVKKFAELAHRYPKGSIPENFFHLLAEVEVVFGIWAGFLLVAIGYLVEPHEIINYLNSLNFTEPAFVFVIMAVAATKPVLAFSEFAIQNIARIFPKSFAHQGYYFTTLVIGPLLGSFITEPAAMTVTAMLLAKRYFHHQVSERFKYLTLGTLFVNVSIGGVLTNFAAPPVVMVAQKFGWSNSYMLAHFGIAAVAAVVINSFIVTMLLRHSLSHVKESAAKAKPTPFWMSVMHLLFLATIVIAAHYPVVFFAVFLFFLGFVEVTEEHQEALNLRGSLLVAYFLAGLVVFGPLQGWWLQPILSSLSEGTLFLGAAALTAITDNAALTYLGSQVPELTDRMRHALVAGAVAGGGLTIIANAPNPVGYSILKEYFGTTGLSPLRLLGAAIVPTLVALVLLWLS